MTPAEALAILEDEFSKALSRPEGAGPKSPLRERLNDAKMQRADIRPAGKRPAKDCCRAGQPVPTDDAHVIPCAKDQKNGAQSQAIQVPRVVQMWHVEIPPHALDVPPGVFRTTHADAAAESLAEQGLDLGLDTFAPLEIEVRDRVARQVGQVTNVREAAIVVYARGWKA